MSEKQCAQRQVNEEEPEDAGVAPWHPKFNAAGIQSGRIIRTIKQKRDKSVVHTIEHSNNTS